MVQLRPAIPIENFFHPGIGKTELARPERSPIRIGEMNKIGAVAERRKHREVRERIIFTQAETKQGHCEQPSATSVPEPGEHRAPQ
jgi:hypothetical protein